MVLRLALRCTNCAALIMFRIRVGYSDRDPFAFECERCSQPIEGALNLDQKNIKILGLSDLKGATEESAEVPDDAYDFAHVHDSHFLVPDRIGAGKQFSTFIDAFQRHGADETMHRGFRTWLFEARVAQAPLLARLVLNYQRGQWEPFFAGANEVLDEFEFTDTPRDRVLAMVLLLGHGIEPFWASAAQDKFLTELHDAEVNISLKRPATYRSALRQMFDAGYTTEPLEATARVAARFFKCLGAFQPLMSEWDAEADEQTIAPDIKLPDTSKLGEMTTIYVEAYEALARTLIYGAGFYNVIERESPDAMPVSAQFPDIKPNHLKAFAGLSAANKRDFLIEYPVLYARIGPVMQNRIRNAFGHNTADLDYPAQVIRYPSGKQQAEITFASMAALAMAAVVRLFDMAVFGIKLWPELI